MYKIRIIFLIALVFVGTAVYAKNKVQVLLWSGQNNHNWKETTPMIQSALEKSGLFEVTITEKPGEISASLLSCFDVIVSNWNTYPEMNCAWREESKAAFMDFVNGGGGFVLVHAASSAHYDWTYFQNVAGATWDMKKTHHGKIAPFKVEFKDRDHPITHGLSDFWTTDELWVDMAQYGTAEVLAQAFSPKSNKGRGQMEPVLFAQHIGKGRSAYLVLGHHATSMRNLGFQTLLLRCAEWAATGKVKQSVPSMLSQKTKSGNYTWLKGKNTLGIKMGDEILWQYHFDKAEGKPYFYPLKTVTGTELTWLRPPDHPWHRGVWFSWKFINGVNYWEENRETGRSDGTTELKDVRYSVDKASGATVTLSLSYHEPGGTEQMTEQRTVFVSVPQDKGGYFIDWESEFTAVAEEVTLDRTPLEYEPHGKKYGGYAGFSARLNHNLWDVALLNDQGESGLHQTLHGTTSNYMSFRARGLKGDSVAVSIFSHPDNLRAPNYWYVTTAPEQPFYYFSPSPLFKQNYSLKKGEHLVLKYRLWVHPYAPNISTLKILWKNYND